MVKTLAEIKEEQKWELDNEFRHKVEEGEVSIDYNGHFRANAPDPRHMEWVRRNFGDRFFFGGLIAGTEDGKNWVEIPTSKLFCCSECMQPIESETNGKEIRVTNPCPYPNGYPVIEFELNVPSGKMVVGNDFRDAFKIFGDYDVNYVLGQAKTVEAYAKIGLAHAFVGNTCPSVFRINEGSFVIGTQDERERNPVKGSRRVAGICTDLWWYSIADYDEYKRRYGYEPPTKATKEHPYRLVDVVKCRPGVYRFRHQYHLVDRDDWKNAQIYTYVDWVREPDPVHDHTADFKAMNFTAGQILADKMEQWRDIYGHNVALAAARHIGHGDTRDYHPNGFLCDNPDIDPNTPDMEIPLFEGPYQDIQFDQHSFLCLAAGVGKDILGIMKPEQIYLNESFTAVAFNLLQQILRYGILKSSGENKWQEEQRLDARKWALKALKGLAKKYPDRVPEYCQELLKLKQ